MVDLGFNGFIDKCENYFGRRPTKALLFVIILTILVVCLNTLWDMVVVPLISSMRVVIRFQSASGYWDLFKTSTIILLGGALSITLVSNWRFRRTEQEFLKIMNEALEDPNLRDLLEEMQAEEALKRTAPKNSIVGQVVEDPPS